jgi:hypothetical protein
VSFVRQFFTKCGILKEDDDGKPRIKIYRDKATGMVKGDGLVTYLKPPSVGPSLCARAFLAVLWNPADFLCLQSCYSFGSPF